LKIQPCPKCGKAKLTEIKSRKKGPHYGWVLYYAVECKCVHMVIAATKREAITNWNKPK